MTRKFLVVSVLSVLTSSNSMLSLAGDIQIGRYTTSSTEPTEAQKNPLSMEVEFIFPSSVKNIKQAFEIILVGSGYRLDEFNQDKHIENLFSQPLPRVYRRLGPIALEDALKVIAGSYWSPIINPVRRTVSFKLADGAKAMLDEKPMYKNTVFIEKPLQGQCKEFNVVDQFKILYPKKVFKLSESSKNQLLNAVKLNSVKGRKLAIRSYTDHAGDRRYNEGLAQARMLYVMKTLKHFELGNDIVEHEVLGEHPDKSLNSAEQRRTDVLFLQPACNTSMTASISQAPKTIPQQKKTLDSDREIQTSHQIYTLSKGKRIDEVLRSWAEAENFPLIWEPNFTWPAVADTEIHAKSAVEAATKVVEHLKDEGKPIDIMVYENAIKVVSTKAGVNED
ncbi:TcpQ domain-containing protein [Thiomicrorhabdus indica]|uniref:PFGI-1 class ICE element type IV pilus protein PilL2 n=1 Tax=Thiomicrorhabdus indica TaxID=2267253 RepID=UPI00102DC32C|nr:TcpQ domain-containing protein [Thiomicrorhabdus indica]